MNTVVSIFSKNEQGKQVCKNNLILGITLMDGTEYYNYREMETNKNGIALRAIYDKMFLISRSKIKQLGYKGENQNSKVRMTENTTVKENKWYKNRRNGK